ncbi:hypothetical protein ACM0CQ_15855 [Mycobacteroides abscessus subsp. abscessus]|uniref:hypothetical protein n=1 Tax=Mycobacteroides abscessus TaxID=36809 RepID=UPI0039EE18FA
MTRFIVEDLAAAGHAAAELHPAARELAARVVAATEPLTDLPDPVIPAAALDALVAWRRHADRIRRAEDALLLLLSECGASPRGLGNALSLNRETVARRIEAARAERIEVTGR